MLNYPFIVTLSILGTRPVKNPLSPFSCMISRAISELDLATPKQKIKSHKKCKYYETMHIILRK